MMNYKKGKNVEEELTQENIPIENLPKNFLWMHVKGGTKITNVVDFAKKALDSKEYISIVWTGSGGGTQKTISCVEIMKREYPLHQVTKICLRRVEEYWVPEIEGLEEITVTREIPCIHILLSLDEIDSKTIGYQFSQKNTSFWLENTAAGPTQKQNKFDTSKRSGSNNNYKKKSNERKRKN